MSEQALERQKVLEAKFDALLGQKLALGELVNQALKDVRMPEATSTDFRSAATYEQGLRSLVANILIGVDNPNPQNLWVHLQDKVGEQVASLPSVAQAKELLSNALQGDIHGIKSAISLADPDWRTLEETLWNKSTEEQKRVLDALSPGEDQLVV